MRSAFDVLAAEGIALARHSLGEHRTACPLCTQRKHRVRDTALAVKIADDGIVWHCHRCHWSGGRKSQGYARNLEKRRNGSPPRSANDDAKSNRIEFARCLWRETAPLGGSLGERYLRGRGIVGPLPASLRYHPNLRHSELKYGVPAVVAEFIDVRTNEFCGIHRTYLSPDGTGKLSGATAKLMLGRAKGAAIKLTADSDITLGLGICEGIETGLSVFSAGFAVWVVGSAGSITTFPLLPGIECLTIFADNDTPGLDAARVCARRWQRAGIEARIIAPRGTGEDWNDAVARAA